MTELLKPISTLFSRPKAADFKARANISLSVFKETIDALAKVNTEALEQKKYHEDLITESSNEISAIEQVVDKNTRVILKIKDILA